jgi:hypothetical protein
VIGLLLDGPDGDYQYPRPLIVEGRWPPNTTRVVYLAVCTCSPNLRRGVEGGVCWCGDAIPGPGEPGGPDDDDDDDDVGRD